MDLLEVINDCAESHRRVKEHSIKYGGHGDGCELHTVILVVRNGNPEVGLIVNDEAIKEAFTIAATTFRPDALVLTRDGVSTRNKRPELSTIAIGNSGEILWKIYPYAVVGDMFLSNGFEVPEEFPMEQGDRVAESMRELMKHNLTEGALQYSQYWPDPEKAQAELDTFIAKSFEHGAPENLKASIQMIQLFSRANTGRQTVLLDAGLPVVLGW